MLMLGAGVKRRRGPAGSMACEPIRKQRGSFRMGRTEVTLMGGLPSWALEERKFTSLACGCCRREMLTGCASRLAASDWLLPVGLIGGMSAASGS